jgi:hypothetical protein
VDEQRWNTRLLAMSVNATGAYQDVRGVQFQTFGSGSMPATTVGFRISLPDVDFLEILSFSLTQFADDSGQDLGNGIVKDEIHSETPYQVGRPAALFRLASNKAPAPAATHLRVIGSAVLRLGAGQRETPPVLLPLRLGQAIIIPGGSLTLKYLEETRTSTGNGVLLHFSAAGEMRMIKALRLLDADVSTVAPAQVWRNNGQTLMQLQLSSQPDAIHVQPLLYASIESRIVPIDQTFALGVTAKEDAP